MRVVVYHTMYVCTDVSYKWMQHVYTCSDALQTQQHNNHNIHKYVIVNIHGCTKKSSCSWRPNCCRSGLLHATLAARRTHHPQTVCARSFVLHVAFLRSDWWCRWVYMQLCMCVSAWVSEWVRFSVSTISAHVGIYDLMAENMYHKWEINSFCHYYKIQHTIPSDRRLIVFSFWQMFRAEPAQWHVPLLMTQPR